MSAKTGINYVHHTFNPWWGCTHAGTPGCDNCYAHGVATRYTYDCFGDSPRHLFDSKHWHEPLAWNRKAEKDGVKRRVLCGSMCDIFEDNSAVTNDREYIWKLIDATPNLFWMLLTKRPEEIDMYGWVWRDGFPANVGLGVTVETQEQVWRIHEIIQYNATLYWVSHEPALGDVVWPDEFLALGDKAWIVTGGESGKKARPMHPDWARHDRDQCKAAGVPWWFKQNGEYRQLAMREPITDSVFRKGPAFDGLVWRVGLKSAGRLLDGREHNKLPECATENTA